MIWKFFGASVPSVLLYRRGIPVWMPVFEYGVTISGLGGHMGLPLHEHVQHNAPSVFACPQPKPKRDR